MSIRRERDAKRVVKSVRTHEATMAAYDRQITTPMKYLESNHWPSARTGDFRPVGHGDEMITPGMGHVTTYKVNMAPGGRYRGIDLTRRGTAGIGDKNNRSDFYNNENKYVRKSVDKILKKIDNDRKNHPLNKEKNNGN
jgi:hypothetical protein